MSGASATEHLIDLATLAAEEGRAPTRARVSVDIYADVLKELSAKDAYTCSPRLPWWMADDWRIPLERSGQGSRTIRIATPAGFVTVEADASLAEGHAVLEDA